MSDDNTLKRAAELADEIVAEEEAARGRRGAQRRASTRMGVDESLVSKWRRGDTRNVRSDTFEKIERGLRISKSYWSGRGSYKEHLLRGLPSADPATPLGASEPRVEREDELTGPELRELLKHLAATEAEVERVRAVYTRDAFKGGWTADRVKGLLEGLRLGAPGKPKSLAREPVADRADAARKANVAKNVKR